MSLHIVVEACCTYSKICPSPVWVIFTAKKGARGEGGLIFGRIQYYFVQKFWQYLLTVTVDVGIASMLDQLICNHVAFAVATDACPR